jgi:hypothetical protein
MIIIEILWITLWKDCLRQFSFDTQHSVFDDMFKENFFRYVIGDEDISTNLMVRRWTTRSRQIRFPSSGVCSTFCLSRFEYYSRQNSLSDTDRRCDHLKANIDEYEEEKIEGKSSTSFITAVRNSKRDKMCSPEVLNLD